jgi:hypothetical protein
LACPQSAAAESGVGLSTPSLMAINSSFEDTEDALQYYTAIKHNVEYFISADKKLKKAAIPQLPVFTAEAFLKEFSFK